METKVLTVKPDDSILDAARIMLEHKISGLPVVDDTRSVLGVITSSDIFRMMIEEREAIFGSSS
jgi:CBS domain-containing protein